jgi:uncharacterized membrane protein YkoI
MENMNRREILAIVLGSVLILGVVGGGFTAAAAATASDGPAETGGSALAVVQDDDEDNESGGQGTEMGGEQDNQTDDGQESDRIPITEAIQTAQDEVQDRNATVVGAELGQEGGLLDFGDDESVYTVDALLTNGTQIEVAVNATNGSVVDVGEREEGFLEGIFGEDEVPQQPLNLSAMYNASEAVELAQNETDANGTVTSVKLNDGDDGLVYEVQIQGADDGETTVVVDAMRDGEGVIEVDGEQVDGGGMAGDDGGEGNETGEDGGDGGMDEGNESGEGDGA